MLKLADKKTRKWLTEMVREALNHLGNHVSSLKDKTAECLPTNMGLYVSAAMIATSDLKFPVLTEVTDAS